jgi:hypothetical protein
MFRHPIYLHDNSNISYDFLPDYSLHHILSLHRPHPTFATLQQTSPVMPRRAMVENRHELETYIDLEALPEYGATRDIFLSKQGGSHF